MQHVSALNETDEQGVFFEAPYQQLNTVEGQLARLATCKECENFINEQSRILCNTLLKYIFEGCLKIAGRIAQKLELLPKRDKAKSEVSEIKEETFR